MLPKDCAVAVVTFQNGPYVGLDKQITREIIAVFRGTFQANLQLFFLPWQPVFVTKGPTELFAVLM